MLSFFHSMHCIMKILFNFDPKFCAFLFDSLLPIEQGNMYKNRVRTKEQHKYIFEFPLLYLAEKMKCKLENLKSMYVILNFFHFGFPHWQYKRAGISKKKRKFAVLYPAIECLL